MQYHLGKVISNEDKNKQKRIQAHIIGLTDDGEISNDSLPWAVPIVPFGLVPEVDDKVWIITGFSLEANSVNFTNLYYAPYTEETYKEVYDYANSDTCQLRKDTKIDDEEEDPVSALTYPKNKVIKIGTFVVEFDLENERFTISDGEGNYAEIMPELFTLKGIKGVSILAKEFIKLYSDEIMLLKSKGGIDIESEDIINVISEKEIFVENDKDVELTTKGNLSIELSQAGKTVSFKNSMSSMQKELERLHDKIDKLADEILNIQTTGTPVLHSLGPASQATVNAFKAQLAISKTEIQNIFKD